MKNKKLRIVNYALAFLGIVVTAILYPRLPEQIPTTWGFDGAVSYSPKVKIWFCCGLLPLLAFLFDYMPSIDPRKVNYQRFSKYYDNFCVFMQIFLFVMLGITLSESLYPGNISVGKIVASIVGVLFMFLGNIMPKIKSNFYLGIKTPWTLSDEEIWNKTQRLAGKTMFSAGLLTLLLCLPMNTKWSGTVSITVLLAAALFPCIMSCVWWRKKYGKN